MERKKFTKCNHNVLSNNCSLDIIIKLKEEKEKKRDNKPDYYCPVCKKYFKNDEEDKLKIWKK